MSRRRLHRLSGRVQRPSGHWSEPLESRQLLTAAMIADIGWEGIGSDAERYCRVGDTIFFSAATSVHGKELWRTDGTAAGTALVKDINPGTRGSDPRAFISFRGMLFFAASTSSEGVELWKSDGTEAGTVLVKDINPGRYDSSPMVKSPWPCVAEVVGDVLYFPADNGSNGCELWRTDGTAEGTSLVKDLYAGGSADPDQLTVMGGALFFSATGKSGPALWKSDGTESGTVALMSFVSRPHYLLEANNVLFFLAQTAAHGAELWKSDGSSAGTTLVADIVPGSSSSYPEPAAWVNGRLLFFADDVTHGLELWSSDGTREGTSLVIDVQPGGADSWQGDLCLAFGDLMYFDADDGVHGVEVWHTDGTPGGTYMVKDVNRPGFTPLSMPEATFLGDALYFAADDGVHGEELWKTDGTEAGTVLVKDVNPSGDGMPYGLYALDDRLLFTALDPVWGEEPWITDGTPAGTHLLKDINIGNASGIWSDEARVMGSHLYFAAGQGELWATDGTPGGTAPVSDDRSSPKLLTAVGNLLFYRGWDSGHGTELWRSDGTAAGTFMVKDIYPGTKESSIASIVGLGGIAYFTAWDGVNGSELWRSDGTEAGTRIVKDILPGAAGSAYPFVAGGKLYLNASDGARGSELWISDGTEAGTVLLKDINPNGSSSPNQFTSVDNSVYFLADDGVHGKELWKTDGTAAGTFLVKDINPGAGHSYPAMMADLNGMLMFMASDGSSGTELWKSDGTSDGTVRVKDIDSGSASAVSVYSRVLVADGIYFFRADDGIYGAELWRSDGTEAGTFLLKDIAAGFAGSQFDHLFEFTRVGELIYFAAEDADLSQSARNAELWCTDGTPEGTHRVFDLCPGTSGSYPRGLRDLDGRLYFIADDGFGGRELWTVFSPQLGGTAADDRFDLTMALAHYVELRVNQDLAAPVLRLAANTFDGLTLDGAGGRDTFRADLAGGAGLLQGNLLFRGGEDIDAFVIAGADPGLDVSLSHQQAILGGAIVGLADVEQLTLDTTRNLPFHSISVENARVTAPGGGVLRTSALTLGPAGIIDLAESDLVIQATHDTRQEILEAVAEAVAAGLQGQPARALITSSPGHILAPLLNQRPGGALRYASLRGETLDADTILVLRALPGDTDINGQIDGDDYFFIDHGYLRGLTGWENGDFDSSGNIDAGDYQLIDASFVAGRPLSNKPLLPLPAGAPPIPTSTSEPVSPSTIPAALHSALSPAGTEDEVDHALIHGALRIRPCAAVKQADDPMAAVLDTIIAGIL